MELETKVKTVNGNQNAQNITSDISDKENEIRYWKINEFSQVTCGGTPIKKTNPGKGRERIEIYLSELG
jgi:alanyl-tRNA synthetase